MMDMIHPNIRKTCRTCLRVLESRKDLISIFDVDRTFPTKTFKFSEMLASICSFIPHEHDALPKRICVICLQQIRSAFFFKSQAENSHNVLHRQIAACNLIPAGSIKREHVANNSIPRKTAATSELLSILAPHTTGNNDGGYSDDMLVEIEPPQLQEQINGFQEEEEEDSDDQEIIDYEPDFSSEENEGLDTNFPMDETQTAEGFKDANGKSPDSGITDNCAESADFNERQLAECQLGELKDFVCNICTKQMISAKALLRHKRNHHSDRCNYCKKRFGSKSLLNIHTQAKHPDKYIEFRLNGQTNAVVQVESIASIPECDSCGAKFCEKEALYKHHADCDKKCIECGLKIPQKSFYYQHLEKEHNIKLSKPQVLLECPFGCLDNFNSERILQEHVQRCHPEDKDEESVADSISEDGESVSSETGLSCEFCLARFRKQRSLKQHISVMHKNEQKNVPKTRSQPKYTRDEFVDKFMVKKTNDFHRCIPCKKDIHRKSLMVHMKGKHAAVKSFRCELCPEAFFRIDYRTRHMTYIHMNQYRCIGCDVQFDRAYKYDAHMTQHGVAAKNFKPDEGNDRFDLSTTNIKYIEDSSTYDYSKQEMQRRMSILGMPYTPPEIPLTKDEFIERFLVNISEKQSQCTICQQKMMKTSILTHILWKHAVKKPLKCAFCNERVVKTNGRLSHMSRCHPNAYKCKDCKEQFAKHATYAEHVLREHRKRVTTLPSSGEEPDLSLNEVRFVSQKNDEEIIEEPEMICIEPEITMRPSTSATSSYQCHTCVKSFTCAKNLQIHNSHKHKEPSADSSSRQVLESNDDPMSFEDFRYNFTESVNDTDVKCLICDQTLKKRNLGNHAKSRHATSGAYKCAICPESFFRPEHRIQHMSQLHRGMFFCETCNIQFFRNSRYAKHMKDSHEIEVDDSDDYEVDFNLSELQFVPYVNKSQEDEKNSSLPSIVHEPETEAATQEAPVGNEMNRDDFMAQYIKMVNKETRRCLACDRTMLKRSLYNHLMRYHATIPPFKCPFCDLRLERSPHRIRHLQVFHPDGYKCHECGIQFQKHSMYADHMTFEHNQTVTTTKAPGEERDLSSLDIKYVPHLSRADSYWQDDEATSSTETSFVSQKSIKSSPPDVKFLKPKIKEEPRGRVPLLHSIFGEDDSLLEEQPTPVRESLATEFSYNDFKARFINDHDANNMKCLPCDKVVIKTSICAHLRLHHSITLSYNCELCSEGFQRSDYRQRHMKFAHPEDYKCPHCDIQFYRSVLFKGHMLEVHKIIIVVPALKTKDEIDAPLEKMKFVQRIPDSMKLCNNDSGRRGGRKLSKPINPDAGGFTFNDFKMQFVEIEDDCYTCRICDLQMTKFSLKKHLKRSHATSKPFYCELCPEGFQKPDDRMQHMAQEHEKDFKCVHCNLQYYLSSDYVEHMSTTHKVKISLAQAKKKSDVDVPMERLRFLPEKLNEDIITPNHLPSTYTRKIKSTFNDISDDAELTREQFYGKFFRTIKGKGELKTKCLACNKLFSSKNRKFHVLYNHATTRPMKCELCDAGFIMVTKRMRHMGRKHKDDYKCTECCTQFDRAKHYVEHMKTLHQVTVTVPDVNDKLVQMSNEDMRYTKKLTAIRAVNKLQREGMDTADVAFLSSSVGPWKCADCDEEFPTSRAHRIHLRHHSNGGVFIKTLKDVKPLELLKEEKVVELVHGCDECEKRFATAFALNAHKKFKHKSEETAELSRKRKAEKLKYEVECDICDFVSPRRDYVEHHVRQTHKPEFFCRHCHRTLSSYNYFIYHLHEHHPKSIKAQQSAHKCNECGKSFRSEDILNTHKTHKHRPDFVVPPNYCQPCGVSYKDPVWLEQHKANYYHMGLQTFLDNKLTSNLSTPELSTLKPAVVILPHPSASPVEGPVTRFKVKNEPVDIAALKVEAVKVLEDNQEESPEVEDDAFDGDPFERMMKQKLNVSFEPPEKRIRLSTPTPAAAENPSNAYDDDKLEYLQYLQTHDDGYKCGICGKIKAVRKYMLHHLKQHKEVPTYTCTRCPEKFVFKKKFEKHLLFHDTQNDKEHEREKMIVDVEHPKFQETTKQAPNEIKCGICQLTFKLTIMLNRHNSTWHGDDNADKKMTMSEQKARKDEPKLEVAVIKLLKCKHCQEAFIKPKGLIEHLKEKHNSESIDTPMELEQSQSTAQAEPNKSELFTCDKCKIHYNEKKFLENHQKHFCIHREKGEPVMNEQ